VPVRGTLTANTPEAEQAAQAIADAAESLDLDLPPIVPVAFAVAALSSYDKRLVVEDGGGMEERGVRDGGASPAT
jgi:hypothetical protein